MDAPTDSFSIFHGVVIQPGRYWWSRYELQYFMNPGRPLSFGAFVNWGQFYGGHSPHPALTVAWRGGGHPPVGTHLAPAKDDPPAGAVSPMVAGRPLGAGLTNPHRPHAHRPVDTE